MLHAFIALIINSFYNSFINEFLILLSQLLTKNPARRLGCVATEGGESAVTSHTFFTGIDWEKLNRREIEPPFRPRIVSELIDDLIMYVNGNEGSPDIAQRLTELLLLYSFRKHQRTSTTSTQILLRKNPPSHPSMTL